MSDMLAVLLGAGSAGESQSMLALAGGKGDGKKVSAQPDGTDPFMAVLFGRMQGAGPGATPDAQAGLPGAPSAEAGGGVVEAGAQLPLKSLKPLEIALQQAQQPALDGAALAAMGQQLLPGGPGAAKIGEGAEATAAPAPGVEPDLLAKAGKGGRPPLPDGALPAGAAETAAPGQQLPRGRGRGDAEAGRTPVDPARVAGTSQVMTVAQGLAGQPPTPAMEAQALASASPASATAAMGLAQGMGVMGEAQARAVTAPTLHMALESPVRSPMFGQELGERIVWLSSRQGQVAEIALNPPHLGPLEVKLSLSGGEAGAQFFSPHAQVREAIEAALPRLREMLAEAGVTLGQAQVRQESFSRQDSPVQGEDRQGTGLAGEEGAPALGGGVLGVAAGRLGLVDLYV